MVYWSTCRKHPAQLRGTQHQYIKPNLTSDAVDTQVQNKKKITNNQWGYPGNYFKLYYINAVEQEKSKHSENLCEIILINGGTQD